jgi:hypothetical protein
LNESSVEEWALGEAWSSAPPYLTVMTEATPQLLKCRVNHEKAHGLAYDL